MRIRLPEDIQARVQGRAGLLGPALDARLAERLGDERVRLDELIIGDLEVRASLALSYAGLDPAARRGFRLLGLLDTPDFADWLAAGLLDMPVAASGDLLERLADAHLLEAVGEDCAGQIRYRFHPLLRTFARERAQAEEPAAVRRAALEAALRAQIALSAHAQRVLSPGGNAQQMPVRTGVRWRDLDPSLAARVDADALGWCEAERAGLVAGVRQAAAAEAAELAWELAGTLPTFFGIRGYWEDWQTTHEVAIAVCRHAGNRHGEAQLLRLMGVAFLWLGEARRAGPCFERSRALAVELGDAWIERWARLGLGLVMATGGQPAGAARDLERALALFRQAGEASGEAVALLGLAECIEYRMLGPVEVWDGRQAVALGGPKPRTLLAMLLAQANHVVSTDRLVDELWGDDPPATARNLVQGYVAGLRARLGRDALRTAQGGYLLRVAPGELDVHRFEALVAEADRQLAAGTPGRARDLLCEALALWRGPALVGTVSETLSQSVAGRLEERRLDALEKRVDADLQLGSARALVGELRALAAAHPLREGLQARLVLALHRSGRDSEAMAAYRAARDRLRRELDVEPGPELRRAERALRLAGEAQAELPAPVPAQLPPSIADFTGREPELAALRQLLERPEAVAPTIVVTSGQGGVGKTTLALRAAHQLRSRFPDGQLFADLRAGEPRPADPGEVLSGFLRALGVDGAAIPQDLGERTALYRARLAGRALLVVLDNAASEAQIRGLLPGGAGCAALVTSRAPLAGLEAARTLALGMLRPGEAVELLTRVAGPRVVAEPAAAARIVELCGCLPLAVRIAGARLAARPHWTLRG